MTDLVMRMRRHLSEDHSKGCRGREYTCDCGYDDVTEGLLELAAVKIERLQAEVDKWKP